MEEAFAARRPAHRLLVVPERRAALEALVLHATALRIPVVEVEGGTLTSLAGFDGHQGVALIVAPRAWATLGEVIAVARERGEPPFVLALDSLEDPQNVGTLLRTAEACGVHGVIFPTRRAAPLSPAAVKASAGAVEHLRLCPVDDLAGALVDLRAAGLRLVGADEDAPLSFRDADLRGPLGLVVGSEARGVSGAVRRRLDGTVRLPMRGRVASLNAAVAGSVLLFEVATQRDGEGPSPTRRERVRSVPSEVAPYRMEDEPDAEVVMEVAATAEPAANEVPTDEAATAETSTDEASTAEPSTAEPSTAETSTDEASTAEPSTAEPATDEAATEEDSAEPLDDAAADDADPPPTEPAPEGPDEPSPAPDAPGSTPLGEGPGDDEDLLPGEVERPAADPSSP